MRRQSRNVLLFVDDAPSHPTAELSNVKLAFFPPNTTSKSQPMDQGIIQTMKLEYRKRQLQHIISTMEQDKRKCSTQLLKGINRERNVLFNDALNTFYLRLYGVIHMVKDHSDSEKGNPLPPHRLLLSISNKGSFICTIPQTG